MVGRKGEKRPSFIKSSEALRYVTDALRQIPSEARARLEGPVRVTLRIFYRTERPDLDESLILDVLQDRWERVGGGRALARPGVYRNDRQVREKHVYHGIDRANPRAEVEVEPIGAKLGIEVPSAKEEERRRGQQPDEAAPPSPRPPV